MEDLSIQDKKQLSSSQKGLLYFFIFSQIVITFFIAYLYSESDTQGNWAWMGSMFFVPFEIIIAILGIIFSSIYLRKYGFKYFTFLALIINIYAIPLFSLPFQRAIAPVLNPLTEAVDDIKDEIQEVKHEKKTQSIYESLLQEFSTQQKVVGIEGPRILLEKGYVIDTQRSISIPSDKIPEFEIWVNDNRVGKNVNVRLGPKKETGPLTSCKSGMDSSVMDIRNKFGFPIEKSGICNSIYATIYLDEKEIGELF